MNRSLQKRLAGMTLDEFREWHSIPGNADKLPLFHNPQWLADQPDPVLEVYRSMLEWERKRPWPENGIVRRVACAAIRHPSGLVVCAPRHCGEVLRNQIAACTIKGKGLWAWHACSKAARMFGKEEKWQVSACIEAKGWKDPRNQGFVDQFGVFMDRQEAWKVAAAAGQIVRRCGGDTANGGTLYSENLY